jgi:hypothetical protein
MRQSLKLHPGSSCESVSDVDAAVTRLANGGLKFHYSVIGTINDIRLPRAATPARVDGLWHHTCFEAFVAPVASAGYCELNFAPSRQWAAYAFAGYRKGLKIIDATTKFRTQASTNDNRYEMHVEVHHLPGLLPDAPWRVGLSAVIEEANGRKSYWALAHPSGKPDFHHPDCFVLVLPAPSRA